MNIQSCFVVSVKDIHHVDTLACHQGEKEQISNEYHT